ncbi:MAG: FAD:protein FMN transferase [Roseibium sp.]
MSNSASNGSGLNRRRFIKVCAAGIAGLAIQPAFAMSAPTLHRWSGIALGAKAEINLLHDDPAKAQDLFRTVRAEIRRLESIFSLYRTDSELARLNETGRLIGPSLDMLELMATVRRIYDLTEGAFDPTVQPLWAYYAERRDDAKELDRALAKTGLNNVRVDTGEITYLKSGMAMTLNGIAQGYITDQVSQLLKSHGCSDIVVDLGEISVSGDQSAGSGNATHGWPVTLRPDPSLASAQVKVQLTDKAVASSARKGTTFDDDGFQSHIIDPGTGLPVQNDLRAASVISNTAAVADGLSTAALVSGEKILVSALAQQPDTEMFVVRDSGQTDWLRA